jgi:hypothetical protein
MLLCLPHLQCRLLGLLRLLPGSRITWRR